MAGSKAFPRLCLVLLGAALAGCAGLVPVRETGTAGSIVVAPIDLGGQEYLVHWYLPAGEVTTLVVLQPGFTRRCANLRETTRQLMATGPMALCIDAPMGGGQPALADALARALAGPAVAPDGRGMPQRVIVAGHSAGAVFAVTLGAALEAIAPGRLAGALLFDPVARADFEARLRAVSAGGRRPVLALLAPPHRCNARSNALPPLRRIEREARDAGSSAFVVTHLGDDATHADVEGGDTDAVAEWACGRVSPANTATLRGHAIRWLASVAAAGGGTP